MTKLWRIPAMNLALHTGETCDKPEAYLVAVLPETERPLTIRALRKVAEARDGRVDAVSSDNVLAILETMHPRERYVLGPEDRYDPIPIVCHPPTDDEVAAIDAAMQGRPTGCGRAFLRDVLTVFCDLRNGAG